MSGTAIPQHRRRGLHSIAPLFVDLFERYMPDPFVLAIILTALTAVLALLIAPKGSPETIVSTWYAGIFAILGFAFQMILILATGHALAHAPVIQRFLHRLVALARTPNQAVVLTFLVAAAASLLNWGFGLVVGAILAREVARQVRVDFGWLVAAAYSGFVVWASGLSSSIALTQATPRQRPEYRREDHRPVAAALGHGVRDLQLGSHPADRPDHAGGVHRHPAEG